MYLVRKLIPFIYTFPQFSDDEYRKVQLFKIQFKHSPAQHNPLCLLLLLRVLLAHEPLRLHEEVVLVHVDQPPVRHAPEHQLELPRARRLVALGEHAAGARAGEPAVELDDLTRVVLRAELGGEDLEALRDEMLREAGRDGELRDVLLPDEVHHLLLPVVRVRALEELVELLLLVLHVVLLEELLRQELDLDLVPRLVVPDRRVHRGVARGVVQPHLLLHVVDDLLLVEVPGRVLRDADVPEHLVHVVRLEDVRPDLVVQGRVPVLGEDLRVLLRDEVVHGRKDLLERLVHLLPLLEALADAGLDLVHVLLGQVSSLLLLAKQALDTLKVHLDLEASCFQRQCY